MTLGGNVPVNSADIIPILVGAHVVKLQSRSFKDGMEVALHLAVDGLANLNFVSPKLFEKFFQFGIILVPLKYE